MPVIQFLKRRESDMKLASLEDLFVSELQDLYSAESQIIKALPKVVKTATSSELQECLEKHLDETREQVKRLDQIFEKMGRSSKGKKCKGMEGLLEEGKELMNEDAEKKVLDAGLIAAAQRVEHYEIAAYGSARTFAETLGHDEVVTLLEQTLEEEKQADRKLSEVATTVVNERAESTDRETYASAGSSKGRRQDSSRRA
jgi:ferritin-like metal-binding protein YciE